MGKKTRLDPEGDEGQMNHLLEQKAPYETYHLVQLMYASKQFKKKTKEAVIC